MLRTIPASNPDAGLRVWRDGQVPNSTARPAGEGAGAYVASLAARGGACISRLSTSAETGMRTLPAAGGIVRIVPGEQNCNSLITLAADDRDL